jgi:hypothetical protein
MTICFEGHKDSIIFTLEKIISYARNNQYIFLAQSIWWISSIIGLQQELVIHIDNLRLRSNIGSSELRPWFIRRVRITKYLMEDITERQLYVSPYTSTSTRQDSEGRLQLYNF